MINYIDISYLAKGNSKQQLAYSILCDYSILKILKNYNPIVAGTIPIEIDIPSSDIDIICEVSDFNQFHHLIDTSFNKFNNFEHQINEDNYVASFSIDALPIEIYAENKPSQKQYAYLHMLIESRLLNILGKNFRKKIIELKLQDYETEPAFGYLLGLNEPYYELLDLVEKSDEELLQIFLHLYLSNS